MGLLSSIELPHWLMIGGATLTTMGFLGLAFTRNKELATNPDSGPPPEDHPRRNARVRPSRRAGLFLRLVALLAANPTRGGL